MADDVSTEQITTEANGKERRTKITKRKWNKKEDEVLVAALLELCDAGWKRDNNIFRSGYTSVLEKELKSKLPGRNLKASPHIESRLKTLKKHCDAITDMRGARGIHWNKEEHTVICEDDDIWEDWVKFHPDAKGLRNRPFLHYDDLYIIFGKNRGNQKGIGNNQSHADKVFDGEEASNSPGNNGANCKGVQTEYDCRELVHENTNNNAQTIVADDGSNGDNRVILEAVEIAPQEPEEEEENNHAENVVIGSDDVDVSSNGVEGSHMHIQGDSTSERRSNKKRRNSSDRSYGFGEVAKIFGTFLKKYDEQFNLLFGLVGRQAAADKASAERRANLNGELMKIPNLSLQARLRAATLIVGDPPKLDLFYSLTDDDRREWVSMLLTGLI